MTPANPVRTRIQDEDDFTGGVGSSGILGFDSVTGLFFIEPTPSGPATTDALPEGAVNLYYTPGRAHADSGWAHTAGHVDLTNSTDAVTVGAALIVNANGVSTNLLGGLGGDLTNERFGYQAGLALTTGTQNCLLGWQAGVGLTTGSSNVLIGNSAGKMQTTGSSNVGIGSFSCGGTGALGAAPQGNICVGNFSGRGLTTGQINVLIGISAGLATTTGSWNVVVGGQAALNQTTASQNVIVGYGAGGSITSGVGNVILGYIAGQNVTTQSNLFVAGSDNSVIADVYFGSGFLSTAPTTYTIHGSGGQGADLAGGGLQLAGGQGTGLGAGGPILLQTAPAGGSTGSGLNALVTRVIISATGTITVPTLPLATANYGLLNLGNGPFDGVSANRFVGDSGGTMIAGNWVHAAEARVDFLRFRWGSYGDKFRMSALTSSLHAQLVVNDASFPCALGSNAAWGAYVGDPGGTCLTFLTSQNTIYPSFSTANGASANDNVNSLGTPTQRFKNIYAGGTVSAARFIQSVIALTDAATTTLDASLGNTFSWTIGGNRTLAKPTNPTAGQLIRISIRQDATGSRVLTLATGWRLTTEVPSVVLSTGAGKTDILGAMYNLADDAWDVVSLSHAL